MSKSQTRGVQLAPLGSLFNLPSEAAKASDMCEQTYMGFGRRVQKNNEKVTFYGKVCILGKYQFSSVAQWCLTLCDLMNHSTLGLPVHHQLPEFTQTHVHWIGDAIQPSHPLLSPSPPAFNLYQHQGLFHESLICMRWPQCWRFSFKISPSNEHPGLISFRMDWLDLLAVLGTLKSLLQHHSSKASVLQRSAFSVV